MNHPDTEEFLVAINKDSTSPELKSLLSKLGITEDNLDDEKLDIQGRRVWANETEGLQLDFKDIGILNDIPYHDIDEGPWVLTNVVFWGKQAGSDSFYRGPKPYGLDFSMSRDSVREIMVKNKLGEPRVLGVSGNVDMWVFGFGEIKVNYSGGKGIRNISVGALVNRGK